MTNAQADCNLRAVPQEHPLGCGVACVAMISGKAYVEAHALFEKRELAWTRGYYCDEMVLALARAGIIYRLEEFDSLRHEATLERFGALVFVGASERYPMGHYLVRGLNGWLNSWVNSPQMIPVQAGVESVLPGPPLFVMSPVTAPSF